MRRPKVAACARVRTPTSCGSNIDIPHPLASLVDVLSLRCAWDAGTFRAALRYSAPGWQPVPLLQWLREVGCPLPPRSYFFTAGDLDKLQWLYAQDIEWCAASSHAASPASRLSHLLILHRTKAQLRRARPLLPLAQGEAGRRAHAHTALPRVPDHQVAATPPTCPVFQVRSWILTTESLDRARRRADKSLIISWDEVRRDPSTEIQSLVISCTMEPRCNHTRSVTPLHPLFSSAPRDVG